MDYQEKYLKYKLNYIDLHKTENLDSKQYIYNQYGGKISFDSLKIGLEDLKKYYDDFWSKQPENVYKESNMGEMFKILDEKDKIKDNVTLIEFMSTINCNAVHIQTDLDITISYINNLFTSIVPFIHGEFKQKKKKGKDPKNKKKSNSVKDTLLTSISKKNEKDKKDKKELDTDDEESKDITSISGATDEVINKQVSSMVQLSENLDILKDNTSATNSTSNSAEDINDMNNSVNTYLNSDKNNNDKKPNYYSSSLVPKKNPTQNTEDNINFIIVNGNKFCRCKILKDVVYYILAGHIYTSSTYESFESNIKNTVKDLKTDSKDSKDSKTKKKKNIISMFKRKIQDLKLGLSATTRGTEIKDLFHNDKNIGSAGTKKEYDFMEDFKCMINVLLTIINISMKIIDNSKSYIKYIPIEEDISFCILNENCLKDIITELKKDAQTHTTTICEGESTTKNIITEALDMIDIPTFGDFAKNLQGNTITMIVYSIYKKVLKNKTEWNISDSDLSELKKFKKSCSLFFSEYSLIWFVIKTKNIKKELDIEVNNFYIGLKKLVEIITKINKVNFTQKGGGDEQIKHECDAFLLLVKGIITGVAIILLIDGAKDLIKGLAAMDPLDITLGTLRLIIGGILYSKVLLYLNINGYDFVPTTVKNDVIQSDNGDVIV